VAIVPIIQVWSLADKPHELFSAFSVYKNAAKLFDVSHKPSNTIRCLSGLRTFAMLHIMLGHRYNWSRGFPNVNSSVFANGGQWTKTVFSALVNVHPIAVDTFFVIGGLLVARSVLHNMEKFVNSRRISF
jgi:peptidoglycan/LPS O-acetylase OafA/YrhL